MADEKLKQILSNTIDGYEREREEAANREFHVTKSLRETIESLQNSWVEKENDLIDIIRECRDALARVVDAVEEYEGTPETALRTTIARATDLLRNRGENDET